MKKFFVLLLIWGEVHASTAAAFLNNGVSARSEGMGRAYSAIADDLDAFYYNPAGLGFQKSLRFNSMVTKMNNVNDVYYFGAGSKFLDGYSAFNYYTTKVGGIPETDYVNGQIVDLNSSFEYSSQAMFFSYGRPTQIANLSWGLNAKYIKEALYQNKAVGYGLDFGLLYHFDDLSLGFTVLNLLEPAMVWDTESKAKDIVERQEKLGVAYRWEDFLFAVDLTMRKYDLVASLGLEYQLAKNFALRSGVFPGNYSVGLGLNYQNFNFDYAYLLATDTLLDSTHKISLGYIFDAQLAKPSAPKEEKRTEPAKLDAPAPKKETPKPVVKEVPPAVKPKPVVAAVETQKTVSGEPITVKKKNIVVGDGKIKCFYLISATSGDQAVEVKVMAVSAQGNLLAEDSHSAIIIDKSEEMLTLVLNVNKKPDLKVKTFIKSGGKVLSYVDILN